MIVTSTLFPLADIIPEMRCLLYERPGQGQQSLSFGHHGFHGFLFTFDVFEASEIMS